VEITAAGQRFLVRSRRRKNAYLAERLRDLAPDDREALARAADVLERVLEDGS